MMGFAVVVKIKFHYLAGLWLAHSGRNERHRRL